jgi:hypothetical protein
MRLMKKPDKHPGAGNTGGQEFEKQIKEDSYK